MRRSTVSSEKPLLSNCFLITSTRLGGISSTELMGVALVLVSIARDDAVLAPEENRSPFPTEGETKVERAKEDKQEQDLLSLSLTWLSSEEYPRRNGGKA